MVRTPFPNIYIANKNAAKKIPLHSKDAQI